MFSLLITIISIALVVVLAIAAIYYGGPAMQNSSSKAAAAAVVNQAVQIAAAGAVAESRSVDWPTDAPVFGQPYLAAMPVPPKQAYAEGTPAAADWTYYLPGGAHHFVLSNKIGKDVCLAINKSHGLLGIPAAWDGTSLVQCFGRGMATASGALAYTFLYDPPGTTAAQSVAVTNATVAAANTTNPTTLATPGYPRLCPDSTVVNSGVCIDSSSASGGSGGGAGTAQLTCTGTYSATDMTTSCVVKNTTSVAMIVASIKGYVDYTYLATPPSACGGVHLAAGESCAFNLNAGFEGHNAVLGPAIMLSYTYGATGTEASSGVMRSDFTYAPAAASNFVLDTFTGTGSLATHVGEVGATWSTKYGSATLNNFTLDGTGGLLNVDGYSSYVVPTGMPAATSNYYIELDVSNPGAGGWSSWLSIRTTANYEIYLYLDAGLQPEVDGIAANGSGGGYLMAPTFLSNTTYKYRFEFVDGAVNVLVDGVQYGTLYSAPKGQGQFYFNPGNQGLTVSRVAAGNLP